MFLAVFDVIQHIHLLLNLNTCYSRWPPRMRCCSTTVPFTPLLLIGIRSSCSHVYRRRTVATFNKIH